MYCVQQKHDSQNGLRTNKHTTQDTEDILFCYLWAKQKAKLLNKGYINLMCDKWAEIRPDKPMSKSGLPTKGKQAYDRALKDLGGNGWPYLHDLERIRNKVMQDFEVIEDPEIPEPEAEHVVVEPENDIFPEVIHTDPAYAPSSKKPDCDGYSNLLHLI